MRASIGTVWGGVVLLGLASACGSSKNDDGAPAAAGDAAEISAGSTNAGSAGVGNAGAVGSQVAGTSGLGGEAGSSEAGQGGDSNGDAGESNVGGTAGRSSGGAAGGAGVGGYPVIDIGAQQTSDKLDVLFVVDSSVSMADKQNILRSSLPSFVNRLTNPLCVDAQGLPTAQQPSSGSAACVSGAREMTPVTNAHFGVITTSLGSHGSSTGVCSNPTTGIDTFDDKAELVTTHRSDVPSFMGSGFLSFDRTGAQGVDNVLNLTSDLQAMVSAAGEHGCGFEAPLEAMYRFLVDPEPPQSIEYENGVSVRTGINDTLLTQRRAFLRPDSSVAVVLLSDESDCSIIDEGVGWFVGSSQRMPMSTSACDENPNDKCCRSCAQREAVTPDGCSALLEDAVCKNVPSGQNWAAWDAGHDSLNLRCFEQRRRFGFDLLYPIERYSDALSNPMIKNRAGASVPNPLFAARDGKGPRSATLVSVSLIVGAPWQDLATSSSLTPGHDLQYLGGAGLTQNQRWPLLIGDRASGLPPTDPFMRESVPERSGQNPLTNIAIAPASSTNPSANAINGHEQNNLDLSDLQYACTFALAAPKVCAPGDVACDCSPDKMGNMAAITAANSPLCQPPTGGAPSNTQYFGKGYPGLRELGFAQLLGARAVPASICPKVLSDQNSADFAYRPAFSALIGRLAVTLE